MKFWFWGFRNTTTTQASNLNWDTADVKFLCKRVNFLCNQTKSGSSNVWTVPRSIFFNRKIPKQEWSHPWRGAPLSLRNAILDQCLIGWAILLFSNLLFSLYWWCFLNSVIFPFPQAKIEYIFIIILNENVSVFWYFISNVMQHETTLKSIT